MRYAIILLCGYLLGSISTGVLLSRLIGKGDVRKQGSGNSGTTNMLRVYGRGIALTTLAGDMIKGVAAVLLGFALAGGAYGSVSCMRGGLLGALGAVLGHDFPVFFGFKGGKGIATSFGCLLVIFPWQTLFAFGVFLVVFLITHYVSAGSVSAAVVLPIAILVTVPFDPVIGASSVFLGLLALARHSGNIRRLLKGEERRIDFSVFKGKKKA